MKYFFPDSQDFVDPSFDFETEQKSILRVRQRDDVYAHELITQKPYDGLLVSKAIVDGLPGHSCKTRYSTGQRFRFYREGAHRYFRLGRRYEVMGDSGAFSYVKFNKPPYSVDDLIEFYVKAGVNKGVSLDHVIFGYETKTGDSQGVEQDRVERKAITLENANSFIKRSADHSFESFGVAQGWDRKSYIDSALALKKMGYKRVTLGGIITLNSDQICSLLDDINQVVNNKLSFHLLGISRVDSARLFKDRNVVSIDSTTPLKQAFMNLDKTTSLTGKTIVRSALGSRMIIHRSDS
ncbi:archaeosine tRNA-ribosyltransferase type 5 [Vibrio variabilis]|uniref:Archaeosine tRNA-ribosyltransferase type 5 n=1 Tax=Vibrio variabilis TaxID=990271 RepID=A0ABQ0JN51_9VIBR|nr:archaeosine tRNA-ribosyltransferase type 5 [Vibrio variabilis]